MRDAQSHPPLHEPLAEPETVLVVDDHPASLELMREVLKGVTDEPVLATSGLQALKVLESRAITVALLDVQMPGMDGFEVARQIRAHPRGRESALIFVTGHMDTQEVSARAYAMGAVDFLAKPIDPQAVRAKVSVFLDLHRKTGELKRQAHLLRESEMLRHENELAHERDLRQAQKLEAVAVLAAGVAHHFNNILQIILGHVETMMDAGPISGQTKKSLEVMQRTGERGAALVQRLLVFSRRESPKPDVADVNTAVTESVALFKPVLPSGITVTMDLGAGPHKVVADARELELLIVNLALNARDAMPQGGQLTIRTRRGAAVPGVRGLQTVRLSVGDTGLGMSDEVKEHLFEPFFTTKGPARGTGLGLATVHAIVSRAGGTVRVDSAAGEGSTIDVILPAAGRGISLEADRAPGPDAGPGGHGETILVVEDEPDLRELIVGQLEGAGYVVLEAADGKSALKLGMDPDARIDLLLCDVIIPGGDGPGVARQLRKRRPTMRVIMMTAHDEESLKQEFGSEGAPVVGLKKPFRTQDMLRRVRGELERHDKSG